MQIDANHFVKTLSSKGEVEVYKARLADVGKYNEACNLFDQRGSGVAKVKIELYCSCKGVESLPANKLVMVVRNHTPSR